MLLPVGRPNVNEGIQWHPNDLLESIYDAREGEDRIWRGLREVWQGWASSELPIDRPHTKDTVNRSNTEHTIDGEQTTHAVDSMVRQHTKGTPSETIQSTILSSFE